MSVKSVTVRNNNVDGAIRLFKAQLSKDGSLSKLRDRADGYKKPGVKLREEKKRNTINSRRNNKNSYSSKRNSQKYAA